MTDLNNNFFSNSQNYNLYVDIVDVFNTYGNPTSITDGILNLSSKSCIVNTLTNKRLINYQINAKHSKI